MTEVRVSYGYGDWWRRLTMAITLCTPLLLGLVSSAPTSRAALPGEYFSPGDLTYGWWKSVLLFSLLLVTGSAAMWRYLARRKGPSKLPFSKKARVETTDTDFALHFDDHERRYSKESIEHLFADVESDRVIVRMRGGREISLYAARDQLQRLVRSLRPDPVRHTARVPIAPVAQRFHGLGVLSILLFVLSLIVNASMTSVIGDTLVSGKLPSDGILTTFAVTWLLLLLSALTLRRRSAVVGTDGVRIDGTLGSRFIPFAEISSVGEDDADDVRARTQKGHEREAAHNPCGKAAIRRDRARSFCAPPGGGRERRRAARSG